MRGGRLYFDHPTKMIDDASAIIVQAVALATAEILHKEGSSVSTRAGRIAEVRVRRSVHEVYRCLGPSYFQRAYRMSYESFWILHTKLATRINRARLAIRRYVPKGGRKAKGGRKGGKFKLPPIRNGRITTSVRLACALRYFAPMCRAIRTKRAKTITISSILSCA